MNGHQLQILLSETPVSVVRYFDTIGSTNDAALDWVLTGAPDFALVAADQQSAGRGRMQRRWITNPGSALAFSVIWQLTPDEETHSSLIPLMAGAAVCKALQHRYALHPQIKWPNDILLNGRKTAGILVESIWQGSTAQAVIGIGVNICPEAVPEEDSGSLPATCVEEAAHTPIDRWAFLREILDQLGGWRYTADWNALTGYIQEHLAYLDQPVQISENEQSVLIGRLSGIDASGALVLQTPLGTEIIRAGDVSLRLNPD